MARRTGAQTRFILLGGYAHTGEPSSIVKAFTRQGHDSRKADLYTASHTHFRLKPFGKGGGLDAREGRGGEGTEAKRTYPACPKPHGNASSRREIEASVPTCTRRETQEGSGWDGDEDEGHLHPLLHGHASDTGECGEVWEELVGST